MSLDAIWPKYALFSPNLNGDLVNKFLNKIERTKLRIFDAKIWLDWVGAGSHIEKL